MMRRTAVLLTLLAVVSTAFSQKYLDEARKALRKDEYKVAVDAVEAAIESPDYATNPETWYTRGNVYLAIIENQPENLHGELPAYSVRGAESYGKALELKTQNEQKTREGLFSLQVKSFSLGQESYNGKAYDRAFPFYEACMKAADFRGNPQKEAIYNLGLICYNQKRYDEMLPYYARCLELGFRTESICTDLAELTYRGDIELTADVSDDCTWVLKERQNQLLNKFNSALDTGDYAQALDAMVILVRINPTRPDFWYTAGVLYDQMGETEQARVYYNGAIELKPAYFEALYNLGASYYNEGADLVEQSNSASWDDYDAVYGQALDKFREAKPFLERALELEPLDYGTLVSLELIYAKLKEPEKREKVKKVLDLNY